MEAGENGKCAENAVDRQKHDANFEDAKDA